MGESTSLAKWSSLELLAEEDDSPPPAQNSKQLYIHYLISYGNKIIFYRRYNL